MNTNYLLYFVVLLGLLAFSSCIKEDVSIHSDEKINILTEENFAEYIVAVKDSYYQNSGFIDEFINLYKNEALEKRHFEKLFTILHLTKDMDVSRLDYLNKVNGVYELMEDRSLALLVDLDQATYRAPDCDRLVEIRNAMLEECDKYIWGLDAACKGAVMIAFWYHWNDKNCGDN